MEKRYQVFVSSTYSDLLIERQEVMHALLELDCIPSGMELFPAANQTQWDFIKRLIDECDYYVIILAGRYGSLGENGIGYTEMEYDYALSIKKPIIAFLHDDIGKLPAEKCETTDAGKEKLKIFRTKLETRLRKNWKSSQELGSVVSRSLIQLIRREPAIGWIRADNIKNNPEINRLKVKISELENELSKNNLYSFVATDLAMGEDTVEFTIDCSIKKNENHNMTFIKEMTWNEIIKFFFIHLQVPQDEFSMNRRFDSYFEKQQKVTEFAKLHPNLELIIKNISPSSLKILTHGMALGLIKITTLKRAYRSTEMRYVLTDLGLKTVLKLSSFKKHENNLK